MIRQIRQTYKIEIARDWRTIWYVTGGSQTTKHNQFKRAVSRSVKYGMAIVVARRDILTDAEYAIAREAGVEVIIASGKPVWLAYTNTERIPENVSI